MIPHELRFPGGSVSLFLLLAGLAMAAPEMIPEEDLVLVGRTAPEIELKTLDGAEFSLAALRGKTVILSFWASWCGPCRQELPALSELQKTRSDIAIYAVNVDRIRGKAQGFLRSVKFDLPIVWDNESVAMGQWNVMSMPTMFLIDSQGTVKWRKVGYSKEKGLSALEAKLDELK